MNGRSESIFDLNSKFLISLKYLRILSELITSELKAQHFRQFQDEVYIRISTLSSENMSIEHICKSQNNIEFLISQMNVFTIARLELIQRRKLTRVRSIGRNAI